MSAVSKLELTLEAILCAETMSHQSQLPRVREHHDSNCFIFCNEINSFCRVQDHNFQISKFLAVAAVEAGGNQLRGGPKLLLAPLLLL